MKLRIVSGALALLLVATAGALAQVDQPTRVVNDDFYFAFTVEANTLVTYEEGGNGFSSVHNPQGGGKGTSADYGLQVFAGAVLQVTKEEAELARLDPPEATTLTTADIRNNTRLGEIIKAAMAAHKREPNGEATVKVEGGPTVKAPYFVWSKSVGSKTHYALLYMVLHGDYFINVQVESSRPFSNAQIDWFTSKLELTKLPAPAVQ